VAHALGVYLPLLLLGAGAGLVRAIGQRAITARGRRAYQITWILMILLGAPLWLFIAAALGWV
jgi:hypothetical protein